MAEEGRRDVVSYTDEEDMTDKVLLFDYFTGVASYDQDRLQSRRWTWRKERGKQKRLLGKKHIQNPD